MEKTIGYQQLKQDLKQQQFHRAYIFHGEETYLHETYLNQIKAAVVPSGFEDFNCHVLNGKDLQMFELQEVVEALPMMAEQTLVVVNDFDIYKLNEGNRELLIRLISDIPEYCVVIFNYDLLEYKRDGKMKKLNEALDQYAIVVNFEKQDQVQLIKWVQRRFAALDKNISDSTAEHMLFLCGTLMMNLVGEISKVAAYCNGHEVGVEDINKVVTPILDAQVFDMTNAITAGDYNKAAKVLSDLLRMQEEPIMILATVGKELRKIYTARISIDQGKNIGWLMNLWNSKSDYAPKLWLKAAGRVSRQWCKESVMKCQVLDRKMKSVNNFDSEAELKLFVMQLAQKI